MSSTSANTSELGASIPAGFGTERGAPALRRVRHVLRRRRRLRLGLIQLIYLGPAVALAFAMPFIQVGPDVDADRVADLLFSLSGAILVLIALVFSLLFLVVPYANTTLTPRLTLFRDNWIVWHSFAFFVAVVVLFAVSGITVSGQAEVSFLVPSIAVVCVLASLAMVRTLQLRALRSLQLGATLSDIAVNGRRVLDALYVDEPNHEIRHEPELPLTSSEVRWPHGLARLCQIDVPALLDVACRTDAVIEMCVAVGEELRHGAVIFKFRGAREQPEERELIRMVEAGPDRTFDQDPLFAFRLFVDIALRAVSPAVNDPVTAVQAIGGIHELLQIVLHRDLEIDQVEDADGALRVLLSVPHWNEFLAAAIDELIPYVMSAPQVRQRLTDMVTDLAADSPFHRRDDIMMRHRSIMQLQQGRAPNV